MTAQIVPMSSTALALSTARQVLRRPALHEERHLHAACIVLIDMGDWVDAERARAMRAQLDREAGARAEAAAAALAAALAPVEVEDEGDAPDENWGAIYARAALGGDSLFLAFTAGLWVLAGFGVLP